MQRSILSLLKRTDPVRAEWRTLAGLYLLASVIRAAACIAMPQPDQLDGDQLEYFSAAENLVHGRGYAIVPQQSRTDVPEPTAFRMPGPSLVMAGAMMVFGISVPVVQWLTVVCSSISIPLIYRFAREFTDYRTALLSAIAAAFYPTWVYYSVTPLSEPFFIPVLFISLIVAVRCAKSPGVATAILCGVCWGLTTLIKPFGLPMMGLTAIYLAARSRFRSLSPSIVVAAAFCMTLSPWVIRNYLVFGEFLPLATEGSETFLGTNNPYVMNDPKLYGHWVSPTAVPEYEEVLRPVRGELDRAQVRNQLAMDYLRSEPTAFPVLAWRRIIRFLTPFARSGGLIAAAVLCSYGVLIVLLIIGIAQRRFDNCVCLHFALLWALTQLVVTAVYTGGLTRGRLPLELVMLPWAIVALTALIGRFLPVSLKGLQLPCSTKPVNAPPEQGESLSRRAIVKR